MKRTITALAILFVIAGQAVCYADGNKLLSQCNAALSEPQRINFLDAGYCMGFLNGLTTTTSIMTKVFNISRPFCMPNNVTTGQSVRIVVKYLKDHPESLHEDEGFLAMLAFIEAFPCKEK